jgi:hydroxyethylthiazole kinase-like uncharacterized protein yjeF
MGGALLLAGRGALYGGAGRVTTVALTPDSAALWASQPELMAAQIDWTAAPPLTEWARRAWVCGCGGGDAVQQALPALLAHTAVLVLDADALNALAASPALWQLASGRLQNGRLTVLTPHPLEAARLLGCQTADIQSDRVQAALALASRLGAICVLKGAGTVVAMPPGLVGARCTINPSGNGLLAAGGTGDVLAGLLGAHLAPEAPAWAANAQRLHAPAFEGLPGDPSANTAALWRNAHHLVHQAVNRHGQVADEWPLSFTLTANELARHLPARARPGQRPMGTPSTPR